MIDDVPISLVLAILTAMGAVLWLWGPGAAWWRSKPREKRLWWVLFTKLLLLASSILVALIWWPGLFFVALLLVAVRITEGALGLELSRQRIVRAIDDLEESGANPEVVSQLRSAVESIHKIGR